MHLVFAHVLSMVYISADMHANPAMKVMQLAAILAAIFNATANCEIAIFIQHLTRVYSLSLQQLY